MRAIIFAAGRGARIGLDHPKALLEVGGKTLLRWHGEKLQKAGVSELVVITGHAREQLWPAALELESLGLTLRERVNPDFLEGSVVSMATALPEIEGIREPILLMDADVLYPSSFLTRLIHTPAPTALLLDGTVDVNDPEPVLVPMKGGKPFDLVKGWRGEAELVGESIGFFKLGPDDAPRLCELTRARIVGEARREPFENVLQEMVREGRFAAINVSGEPWLEIDFPKDIRRARDEILPRLESLETGE